jgi:putative colanic acid biosynthesis acetyltransferase WcaF
MGHQIGDRRVDLSDVPSPHRSRNKIGRALWGVVWTLLYRPSPKVCHGWRRLLLRLFGAKIGRRAHPHASARIWAPWNLEMGDHSCLSHLVDCYCVDRVRIGAHATVSQYAFLCTATHDYTKARMPLVTAPITVGDGAWICASAFVGPGVEIGEGAVVGACAVVSKNVSSWTVVAGNPACVIGQRTIEEEDIE